MGKRVLAAIDFSEMSTAVLREASLLSRRNNAVLHLLHVGTTEPGVAGAPTPRHRELWQRWQDLATGSGVEVEAAWVSGRTVETILQHAHDLDVDWIVVGSHGRTGLFRELVGSVTEALLRESTRPLLIVPPRALNAAPTGHRFAEA